MRKSKNKKAKNMEFQKYSLMVGYFIAIVAGLFAIQNPLLLTIIYLIAIIGAWKVKEDDLKKFAIFGLVLIATLAVSAEAILNLSFISQLSIAQSLIRAVGYLLIAVHLTTAVVAIRGLIKFIK